MTAYRSELSTSLSSPSEEGTGSSRLRSAAETWALRSEGCARAGPTGDQGIIRWWVFPSAEKIDGGGEGLAKVVFREIRNEKRARLLKRGPLGEATATSVP